MIADVTGGSSSAGQKRYGIQHFEAEEAGGRGSKRARVEEDDD